MRKEEMEKYCTIPHDFFDVMVGRMETIKEKNPEITFGRVYRHSPYNLGFEKSRIVKTPPGFPGRQPYERSRSEAIYVVFIHYERDGGTFHVNVNPGYPWRDRARATARELAEKASAKSRFIDDFGDLLSYCRVRWKES